MVKCILLPCFHRFFNYSLNLGKYPKLGSHCLILPIYKYGNAHGPYNYRGIAITKFKEKGKEQESMPSSTTPDLGHHMGK